MPQLKKILDFLKKHQLIVTTAESCTGGKIIHLLSTLAKSGECLDISYVVYSEEAKKKVLGVHASTIKKYTLTSEEVAKEMALGAFKNSKATVTIATTGIAGSQPMDGIPPGTICFAWGFKSNHHIKVFSLTKQFQGTRIQIQKAASEFALAQISTHYDLLYK